MVLSKLVWPALTKRYSPTRNRAAVVFFQADDVSHDFDTSTRFPYEKILESVLRNFFITPLFYLRLELYAIRSPFYEGQFQVYNIDYKTVDQRFTDTSEGFGEVRLNLIYNDMAKLQKEIAVFLCLLETLIQEMRNRGTGTLAREYISNINRMKQDEFELFEQIKEKRKILSYLQQAVRTKKQLSWTATYKYNNSLKKITNKTATTKMAIKYIREWQNARKEQNQLKLALSERNYETSIEQSRLDIRKEIICHENMEAFIDEIKTEQLDKIQTWMENYDTTLEEKEADIYTLSLDLEKLIQKHDNLKLEYEKRKEKIEECLAYKKRREEEKKVAALQNWAATKIQAWWKGVMFRKRLGHYKKLNSKKRHNKRTKKGRK